MILTSNQIEMFPELNETEKQQMQEAARVFGAMADQYEHTLNARYEQQLNGTRADDIQAGGSHYKDMGVQPWTVMEALLTKEEFVGYLKGNLIKYAMRQGKKDSPDAEKWHHYKLKLEEITNG
jgi:hypothetical protein